MQLELAEYFTDLMRLPSPVDSFRITHLSNGDIHSGKWWQIQILQSPLCRCWQWWGALCWHLSPWEFVVSTWRGMAKAKCWQLSAEKLAGADAKVLTGLPGNLSPISWHSAPLHYPWVFTLGDVQGAQILQHSWTPRCSRCPAIRSLVRSAIGCSAVSQSGKQCAGMLLLYYRDWSPCDVESGMGPYCRKPLLWWWYSTVRPLSDALTNSCQHEHNLQHQNS